MSGVGTMVGKRCTFSALSSNREGTSHSLTFGTQKEIKLAEKEGFEPSVPFPAHNISNVAQSATLSPLRRHHKKGH